MNKEQITALAREHGTSYTNRHFVGEPAVAFGNEAWAAFCEALVAMQPPTVEARGVIKQYLAAHRRTLESAFSQPVKPKKTK